MVTLATVNARVFFVFAQVEYQTTQSGSHIGALRLTVTEVSLIPYQGGFHMGISPVGCSCTACPLAQKHKRELPVWRGRRGVSNGSLNAQAVDLICLPLCVFLVLHKLLRPKRAGLTMFY